MIPVVIEDRDKNVPLLLVIFFGSFELLTFLSDVRDCLSKLACTVARTRPERSLYSFLFLLACALLVEHLGLGRSIDRSIDSSQEEAKAYLLLTVSDLLFHTTQIRS